MIHSNGKACDVPQGRVMRQNISQLGSDVLTLMELQTELLQLDLREWTRGMVKSAVAIAVALVLLLATAPVLLISLGYFINDMTDLSMTVSMLIAAGAGILLAAIAAGLGMWMLKRDKGMLRRFSPELKRNVRWLKQVMSRPATPTIVS
jgi:Putative Actinobacterial Holin-X, holin superfamily III